MVNRTVPHRGGVPKGRRWVAVAATSLEWARGLNGGAGGPMRKVLIGRACQIVKDHSRKAETRAEAARLLKILESR